MKKIKNIKPGAYPEDVFAEGYADFMEDIMDRLVERLVWSLTTGGSPQVDKTIEKASRLAERLRPHWQGSVPKPKSLPEGTPLDSLPDWALELFEQSYVGRQAAFLGAMEGDEASFVVLLLQAMFTVDALKTVCQNRTDLAAKYASRCLVWPWFVSKVKSFNLDLNAKLGKINFGSRTIKKHKMGTTLVQPAAAHMLGTIFWMRLVADSWETGDAEQNPVIDILRNMPDLGGKKLELAKSVVHAALEYLLKDIYSRKLLLPCSGFDSRPPSLNKREIKRIVDQLVGIMFQPAPSTVVPAAHDPTGAEAKDGKSQASQKAMPATNCSSPQMQKGR